MNRNYTLDYLRALAAIMVCICHFRQCLPPPFLNLAEWGHAGVQIFFVISGFVIPFTMAKGGYTLKNLVRFWIKRLIRLHPTYVVAILATFVITTATTFAKTSQIQFSIMDLIRSAFYLQIPPENPVIWTLIIELKYYFLVAFTFPLLFSRGRLIRLATFSSVLIGATVASFQDHQFIPYFLLGFAAAYTHLGIAPLKETIGLATAATLATLLSSSILETSVGALAFLAVLLIKLPKWNPGYAAGEISYSLYLLHFPIGVKFINLLTPHTPQPLLPLLIIPAMLASTVAAIAIYYLVERPSIAWSKRIRYANTRAITSPTIVPPPSNPGLELESKIPLS